MRNAYRCALNGRGIWQTGATLSGIGVENGRDGWLGSCPCMLLQATCRWQPAQPSPACTAGAASSVTACTHLGRAPSPGTSRAGRWSPQRTSPRQTRCARTPERLRWPSARTASRRCECAAVNVSLSAAGCNALCHRAREHRFHEKDHAQGGRPPKEAAKRTRRATGSWGRTMYCIPSGACRSSGCVVKPCCSGTPGGHASTATHRPRASAARPGISCRHAYSTDRQLAPWRG